MHKFEPGFSGHDSMREKAERMFRHEGRETPARTPESMSSPGHTKMRNFKEGGHAEHKSEGGSFRTNRQHAMNRGQTDMHIPRREPRQPMPRGKMDHFAEGGHAEGGMKGRGGKAHHKHRVHKAPGGMISGALSHIPLIGGLLGGLGSMFGLKEGGQPFKRGGHAHRKHRHHKATGGGTYESQMVGEHPSHKRPHINYETDMKGEHMVRAAKADGGMMKECGGGKMRHGGHAKKKANGGMTIPAGAHATGKGYSFYAEGGSTHKSHGGKLAGILHKAEGMAMRQRKSDGGEAKREPYAMGGVGKIRHNQASKNGKQIANKHIDRGYIGR